jgi:hypothetical protein
VPPPARAIPAAPFGYAGAVLVALAGVPPLASVAVLGDVTAGELVPGSGLLLAAAGAFAAGCVRARRTGWAWTAGLAALAIAARALGAVNPVTAQAGLVLDGGTIGVRRALVGVLTGEIGWRAGLVLVVLGAVLLVLASGLHATRPRATEAAPAGAA